MASEERIGDLMDRLKENEVVIYNPDTKLFTISKLTEEDLEEDYYDHIPGKIYTENKRETFRYDILWVIVLFICIAIAFRS